MVDSLKGQALADEYSVRYFETSAKTNTNVMGAFVAITEAILKEPVRRPSGSNITDRPAPERAYCC